MIVQDLASMRLLVPMHAQESEQMVYVMQGRSISRCGEEGRTSPWRGRGAALSTGVEHQSAALDDTVQIALPAHPPGWWRARPPEEFTPR